MLSPAGISIKPEVFDFYPELEKRLKKQKRKPPPRCLFNCCLKCVRGLWKCKCSPFGIMRCCGRCCVNGLLKNFVKRRFVSLPLEEQADYKIYLHQTLLRKGSTEYALFVCFDHLMHAHHSLANDDRLFSLPIPVSFYYGDRDWMFNEGGENIVNKSPFKGTHSHVFMIDDSDHHLYFDNPAGFVESIFKDLSNIDELISK